ncbi:hypothetical protein ACGFZK_20000 [Streptomyces sp. NPDC048257]|uniref:hypothetical protein n=1 Tax=Streptomyces sp. NPDC048257 TaxID=3365526 RepID=UPI00371614EF
MRTALRTSLATAFLAGALLAPVAGTAYAATTAAPAAAVPDRYAGTPVSIDKGVVAVLRNKSEGPEAWIRAVPEDWKPGDEYMSRVLATLDSEHPAASVSGLELRLVEEDVHHPVLSVTKDGKTSSYPLPKGQGPQCTSEPVTESIGAGGLARLLMSPNGPIVQLDFDPTPTDNVEVLDRNTPSLPKDAGIVARILNASSAKPVFEWKTQGGNDWYGHATFPKLPKGCTFDYTFQAPTEKPQPDPKPSTEPSTKPSATTSAAPRPQTAGQTSVVPKGGVAAGAEIATRDTDDSTTVYAGAGLAAIVAGLGAAFLTRRRARTQR